MAADKHPVVETDAWGIDNGYVDALEKWRPTSAETRRLLMASMGAGSDASEPPSSNYPLVVQQGTPLEVHPGAHLTLEDGTDLRLSGYLPLDLPIGYHQLNSNDSRQQQLIIAPKACYLPDDFRTWGWAVQLYAARSKGSWGIGDLADLRLLAQWSADQGAGIMLVNPLTAVTPIPGQQPSPYFPTSRRFRNPLYLRVEEVPGAGEVGVDLERLAAAGRALNSDRKIDREAVFLLKDEALRKIWSVTKTNAKHQQFCKEGSKSLQDYGTFCVLAETFGHDWRRWPQQYRRPDGSAIGAFAAENADKIAYHCWLQWLLSEQLASASSKLPVMQDLPIGVDPGGADAWAWQDILATDVSVGAPPDIYEAAGQNWGLPPFVPYKLCAAGYMPFIETIRASLQHAGGLRIDHVMGMFRLFWIPYGASAKDGTFVRYRSQDMLSIIALESQRASAFVVGEDLGTVEPPMREQLAQRKILSYRLVWFEEEPPKTYPELALAAVTTHDLPTIAGMWTGADIRAEESIGKKPNVEALGRIRSRLADMIGADKSTSVEGVILKTHECLAQAPSAVVTATLDDALAVEERPNMPGTVNEWPNWSIALPKPIEEITQSPLANAIAEQLSSRSATV